MTHPFTSIAICRNAGVWIILLLIGCAGIDQTEVPPDERFGHRYVEAEIEEDVLEVAPSTEQPYFLYNLPVQEVIVRKASVTPESDTREDTLDVSRDTPVDLLLKGALPDHCLKLHEISQSKTGRFIDVDIQMRRLRQETCQQIRRPFRLYITLDQALTPGSYTLRINGEPHPFEIREPSN